MNLFRNISFGPAIAVLFFGAPAAAVDESLVPSGAVWRYEAEGTDLGTVWRDVAYADGGWLSGPAQLGYGDGDEATVLPASPVRPCYYFRHHFTVTDPAQYGSLSLEVLVDDGCVVYLNGQEVGRYGMPAGTITYATWASSAAEYTWTPATPIGNLLIAGENVLAVEVHQGNATSSDVSFDLRLTGRREITVTLNNPADFASGVPIPAALSATAVSPQGAPLDVTFYGRPTPAAGPDFTLVLLPDTQNYTAEINGGTKEMLLSQTDWIANNRDAFNIVYVAQVGDITDSGDNDVDESEWLNAASSLARLRSVQLPDGIPYGIAVGNHDQNVPAGDTEPTTLYNQYFGITHFQGKGYFGGAYGGQANNQYQVFSASGLDFIVIYMEFDLTPDAAVLSWANQLLQLHPQRRGIVVSHSLLEISGAWSAQGSATYEALKGNPNLFLMLCGHNTGEVHRRDEFNGHTVDTVMADYQGWANGGGGYLRLLYFSPANNLLRLQTYSPWLLRTNTASDLALTVSLNSLQPFAVLQQNLGVTSGEISTANWSGLAPGVPYDWYVSANDGTGVATSPMRTFITALNSAPTVAIISPVNGAQFPSGETAITLQAAASDPGGQVVKVEFFDGANKVGESLTAPYACTLAPTAGSHSFTAVAFDNTGLQSTSEAVTIIVGPGVPAAPTDLNATPQSYQSVALAWVDNSSTEQGFEIFVSANHGESYSSAGRVDANTTSALITGLSANTEYYFYVQAFNIDGWAESSTANASTPPEPQPPPAPGNLIATALSTTGIVLSWEDNSADETGFLIETSSDGLTWSSLTIVNANTTAMTDNGLVSGAAYYYRVYAVRGSDLSQPSNMAAAAPFIEAFANGETTVIASVSGDRSATVNADLVFETLTEKFSGSKNARTSALEHFWIFDLSPGQTHAFFLKAGHSPTADGESFVFSWSSDNVNYQDLLLLTDPPDAEGYRSAVIPGTAQGMVYIRVRDTDRTVGKTAFDSLTVDHMFIRTDAAPVLAPPIPPVLTQALAGDQSVSLNWNASPGAASYTVWRRTAAQDYGQVASGLLTTSYSDSQVQNGITYSYVVTAENAFGQSPFSEEVTATPAAPAGTEPPTGLAASGAKRKIVLTWIDSVTPGVVEYQVFRSSDGINFTLRTTIPPATTWSEAVPTGTQYWYLLRAVSGLGTSPDSNISSATAK